MAKSAHLPFEPLGTVEEYTAVLESPDIWHPRHGPRLLPEYSFGPSLQRQIDAVERHRLDSSTVVVAGTFAVGAALAAEKHGLPLVKLQGQPSAFFGAHDPPVLPSGKKMGGPLWLRKALVGLLDKTMLRSTIGKDLNAVRGRLGLERRTSRYMGFYVEADLCLCLFPDWFAAATPDWPGAARHVGFLTASAGVAAPLDPETGAFLDAGPPPVVFTPGPAGYQHSGAFFDVAADALARTGRRGLFVTRGIPVDAPARDDLLVCDYAPFQSLFPRASLIVHHGGIGTVAHALAAGRPQLVTPFGFDQPDNGWRVKTLGAGDVLPQAKLTGERLAEAIDRLLASTDVAAACASVAERFSAIRQDPAALACDLIEQL
jgi:UDP:flavonoid glycosyltransferase YjiC (YdhE family)